MGLFRRRHRALMDLLPWDVFVAEGCLLNADGALSATVSYRGPDRGSSTAEDLVGLRRTLVQAFRGRGDGWLFHWDLHRVPAPEYPEAGAFPDAFTWALDEERRRRYAGRRSHYLSEQYLTLTWKPGVEGAGLETLLRPDLDGQGLEGRVEEFESALEEILGVLSAVLRVERLETAEMVRYLSRCLTFRRHPLGVPEEGSCTLEHLFGAGDLFGGTELRFGETHIVPIRVAGFPEELSPDALDLSDAPLPFRETVRFIPLDPYRARAAVKRRRSEWNTAGVGFRQAVAALFGEGSGAGPAFSERFAPLMAEDADDALLELDTSQTTAGYLTPVFFTSGESREEALGRARRLLRELRNAGYPAAVEETNALDAYLGALPGNGRANVRRPLFTLEAAVCLAPSTSVWAGEARHPHPQLCDQPPTVLAATSGSTPFAFSPSVADVQHAAVIGPTGAGKSVFLALLLAQYFRYPGAQVFALDKGYSLLPLVAAAGGAHYDLAPQPGGSGGPGGPGEGGAAGEAGEVGTHRFAPLAHLETAENLQRATEWLLALLEIAGLDLTPALQRTVGAGLRDLRETPRRSLSTFALKAQSHAVRDALDPYVGDGPYAHLFDGASSELRDSRFVVFEMEDVLGLREAVVAPLVLHLFSEIERRLGGAPTLIAVEELGGYLHRPLFARRFESYLLELRKKVAGLVLVNQSVTTLLDSPLRSAVVEGCPTKVFLPNPSALEPAVAEAYRSVGLGDRQIEILAEATPRRDYYVSTPVGSRLFRLDLSPAALSVLGLAGPAARRTVEEAVETWGAGWLPRYLAELGHRELAELVGAAPTDAISPTSPTS